MTESQLQEYRSELLLSIQAVGRYNGSEPGFRELMQILNQLDQCITRITHGQEGTHAPISIEQSLYRNAHPDSSQIITVTSLLNRAQNRVREILAAGGIPADVTRITIDGTVLPPDDFQIPSGDNSPWDSPEYRNRLGALFTLLQDIGTYTDDVLLCQGTERQNTMRGLQGAYTSVEIPRLNWKEVLISNRVGEGTRVSQQNLGVETIISTRKRTLDQLQSVAQVYDHSDGQWRVEMREQLIRGVSTSTYKIEIQSLMRLRQIVRSRFTSEEWLQLSTSDVEALAIEQQDFLETIFQISGEVYVDSREERIKWGGRIFGFGDESIQIAQLEFQRRFETPLRNFNEWREDLLAAYPSSTDWLLAKDEEPERLRHLLYSLGFDFDLIEQPANFIKMGIEIYGNNSDFVAAWENRNRNTSFENMVFESTPERHVRYLHLDEGLRSYNEAIQLYRLGFPSIQRFRKIVQDARYFQRLITVALPTASDGTIVRGRYDYIETTQHIARGSLTKDELEQMLLKVEALVHAACSAEEEIRNHANISAGQNNQALTALTPIVSNPALANLTPEQRRLLQILVNLGDDRVCNYRFLARLLDPHAINFDGRGYRVPYRGKIRALANQLRQVLNQNDMGGVSERLEGGNTGNYPGPYAGFSLNLHRIRTRQSQTQT